MDWYSVKLLYKFTITGKPDEDKIDEYFNDINDFFEESILLVAAESFDEAYQTAENQAQKNYNLYENKYGQKVKQELIEQDQELVIDCKTSVEDFVKEFKIKNLNNGKITSRTYENYGNALRRFTNKFEGKEIGSINLIEIHALLQEMVDAKIDGTETYKYAEDSLRLTVQLLNRMFLRAVKKGYLTDNPFEDADFNCPKANKQPGVVKGLQGEELTELLMVILGSDLLNPIITVMLNTGIRTQEVLALRWRNLNLETGAIHITNAITTTVEINEDGEKQGKRKTILSKVKTNKSNRIVYIEQDILTIIRQWKIYASENTKTKFGDDDYIFGNTQHPNWTYGGFRTAVNKYLEQSDYSKDSLRLHSLRHTVATMLALDGATSIELMKQLGHSHIETTLRYIDDAKEFNIKNKNRICKQLKSLMNIAG